MNHSLVLTLCFGLFIASSVAAEDLGEETVLEASGIEISAQDVRHYIQERIASGTSAETFTSSTGLRAAIENLMTLRVLGAEARSNGIKNNAQIEWEVELHRERLLFREFVAMRVAEELKTSDWEQAAREEYTANPNKYRRPEEVRASHILIGFKDRSELEAEKLAREILSRARAGESFEKLAKAHSDDPSVERNSGDMGFFDRKRMVEPFADAAFAMSSPSQLSDLVRTQFGFHIIKYHERRGSGRRDFEEVKGGIIGELQSRVPARVKERLMTAGRSPTKYQVNEQLLNKLEHEYASTK